MSAAREAAAAAWDAADEYATRVVARKGLDDESRRAIAEAFFQGVVYRMLQAEAGR